MSSPRFFDATAFQRLHHDYLPLSIYPFILHSLPGAWHVLSRLGPYFVTHDFLTLLLFFFALASYSATLVFLV